MNCPLCETSDIKVIEKVDKKYLNSLYMKMTNTDFLYLLKKDMLFCECKNCYLRYYDPIVTGDELFYNSLQHFDWYYMDEKDEYQYAKNYIALSDRVLEVGSGKGAFAKHIVCKDYVGLDFSENAKILAAENGIKIENELIQDYSKTHKEEFDVVVSFQVLEHVPDPKQFIEAKLEALKKGGKLILAVPSEDSFLKYVENGILNMPPHHVTRWSDKTFEFIAQQYELNILNIYHEKVQESHKHLYLYTLISNSFQTNRVLNKSLYKKVINKLSWISAKFLLRGLEDEMLPNGHTVVVVFEKK